MRSCLKYSLKCFFLYGECKRLLHNMVLFTVTCPVKDNASSDLNFKLFTVYVKVIINGLLSDQTCGYSELNAMRHRPFTILKQGVGFAWQLILFKLGVTYVNKQLDIASVQPKNARTTARTTWCMVTSPSWTMCTEPAEAKQQNWEFFSRSSSSLSGIPLFSSFFSCPVPYFCSSPSCCVITLCTLLSMRCVQPCFHALSV